MPEFGDRRLLLLKMRGCILSGGYFPNAPVRSGQTEEKSAFRTGRTHPV